VKKLEKGIKHIVFYFNICFIFTSLKKIITEYKTV